VKAQSFTKAARKIRASLESEVSISAYTPDHFSGGSAPESSFKQFVGLWDTGATASVITQKVVDELGLKLIDYTTVRHAQGTSDTEVYLIDVGLPNKVAIPRLRVTKGVLGGIDMLIGMDVIGKGDFAVSNFNGITMFTFRIPSVADADFTGKAKDLRSAPVPAPVLPPPPLASRNAPCPCGSGKKYKKCCGAPKQ